MRRAKPSPTSSAKPTAAIRHTVLLGLGNIGSQAADLLARLGIAEMTLVDQGTFESKNISGQAIDFDQAAAGRPKVQVIAERLRRINPDLVIHTNHAKLQDVPLAHLRADVMVCGLDSRLSRAAANQAAIHLGIPTLIDAGVEPSQLLARVNVHRPNATSSCLTCGWNDQDYNLIEATNPCQKEDAAPSTNAPAALGALAASLLALEFKKLLHGDTEYVAAGRQITYCALTHKLYVTAIDRNRQCRCDHAPWLIAAARHSPAKLSAGMLLKRGQAISVPGKTFISALVCRECGARRKVLRLLGRLAARQLSCSRCGAGMVAPGFDQLDRLDVASLGADSPWLTCPLTRLGIVAGDILYLHARKGGRHLEMGRGSNGKEAIHA
jgi:molybdopterin/thiamine biosynthesis adenylyltransferase